jgi:hypothetical protein
VAVVDTPTVTPTETSTLAPTDTPLPPTDVPTTEVPPTAGPPTETATRVVQITPSETAEGDVATATETPTTEGPTAAPSATLDPSVPTPVLAAIPPEATFTRVFTTTADGDFPFGLPRALGDGQVSTWASLRNGRGVWIFDLGGAPRIAGMRLYALRDRDQDTTLLGIDISDNGQTWTPLYAPTTQCGDVAGCQVIPQAANFDLPFGPINTRYVRLRSGPTAFALAEVQFAVLP